MHDGPRATLVGLTTEEIKAEVSTAAGLPAYRGAQISEWIYRRILPGERGGYSASFDEMTDLPRDLRDRLDDLYEDRPLNLAERHEDPRDGTVKLLARLQNGNHPIECVLLPDTQRVSVCLSTQAGCPIACTFCATGTQGLTRNLTAAEIVAQFLLLQSQSPRRITHIVFMGMGEPLLNFDYTLKAIRILNKECGVAMRHITLSTVGIIPNIDRLAAENLQLTLAVSLHAANDVLRLQLVPVARTYSLDQLMAACRRYAAQTHRRLTFEYVLLREINDRPSDAHELAALVRDMPAAVNIIPYNPTAVAAQFQRPEAARVATFRTILESAGISVTQRKERGRQIAAACGQLVTESVHRRPAGYSLPVVAGAA